LLLTGAAGVIGGGPNGHHAFVNLYQISGDNNRYKMLHINACLPIITDRTFIFLSFKTSVQ
jgi:hypothetical protein